MAGGILLVAGCCIGAGMLGLPVMSARTGFYPTLVMFFASWLFMLTTGLLLLEVNLWFEGNVSIVTMADKTLGTWGKCVAWFGFLFIFYALFVAYISGIGQLTSEFIFQLSGHEVSPRLGSTLITCFFGWSIFSGTRTVDWVNRFLVAGLVVCYFMLIGFGLPHIQKEYLQHRDWSFAWMVVPTMIISFGFHNMVPSLTTYFHGNLKRLVTAIVVGSFIPLGIYLLWESLILGLIPPGIQASALNNQEMATQALTDAVGQTLVSNLAEYFAFFAITSSFITIALSFFDFLADGLQVKKNTKGKIVLSLLVVVPPFIFSFVYPKLF
jgi:tyrosine-specific transport protein